MATLFDDLPDVQESSSQSLFDDLPDVDPEATTDQLGSRFIASVGENTLLAAQGLERLDRYIPVNGITGLARQFFPEEVQQGRDAVRELQERTREFNGVTTPADTTLEKIAEGAGSLPPVIVAGPAAPLVNAGLMGESQVQDAQRYAVDRAGQIMARAAFQGRSLTQQEQEQIPILQAEDAKVNAATEAKAFGGGAAMGAVTEYFLGVPAMLRGGGGRRVLDALGMGYAREATQEGTQQLGSNLIAQGLYDPNREAMEGVKDAAYIGGFIGSPTNALLQSPREGPPDTSREDAIIAQVEDRDEPDLSRFGSAAREEAPAPTPITPEQNAVATILNQDPEELRQQEAIVTGNPVEVAAEPTIDELEATQQEQRAWLDETLPEVTETATPAQKALEDVQIPNVDEIVANGGGTVRVNYQGEEVPFTDFVLGIEGTDAEVLKVKVADRGEAAKGIGTLAYIQLGNELASRGITLRSSNAQYADGRKLWDRLVKQGYAERTGSGQYQWKSATPEAVEAPLAAEEGQGPTPATQEATAALAAVEPDTFERLADEPLREGWVGYQDPDTLQVFQVPEGSTPEVIQQRLQEVRAEESDAFKAEREATLERELMQQRFDENVQRLLDEQAKRQPLMRKDLTAGTKAREVWSQADKLTFTLDREKMRLSEAKKNLARLQSSANQRAKQDAVEEVQVRTRGVEILQERVDELTPKVEAAKVEVKKMKRGKKSEEGSTAIPDAVLDLGRSIYRKGMEFADWSRAMVRNLGVQIRPMLRQIWDTITKDPASRRAPKTTGMQAASPAPEGGAVGSRGGSTPIQPPQTPPAAPAEPEKGVPVGVMNASVDAARVKMGMPPAMAPARITLGGLWEQAMAIISQDPNIGSDLVTQLTVAPREITPVETAILVHERVKRETEYMRAINLLSNSATEGEKKGNTETFRRAAEANQALFDVTKKVGTLAGQALAARKLLVNEDLSLARMLAENRAAQNGAELSPQQVKEITEMQQELVRLRDELAKREEKQSQQTAMEVFKSMMKEMNSERKEAVKTGKSVTEFLNEQADKARERLRSKMTKVGSAPDPTILVDLSIIGASHIANGIKSITDFTVRMVEEFGEEYRPYIPDIFTQSQKLHESNEKVFQNGAPQGVVPANPTPADILKDAPATLDPRIVFDLARAYVRQGVTGMENVMAAVHADLSNIIPGLDIRDVRDAFSGYGKITYPSKADDLIKLREYKVLARLTSQLEDVMRRQAPLRTGPQRDKLSAEARILTKQIGDLMKKYDIRTTSPEQQLKTSADAVKARLRNQIEELEKSIQENQALPSNRRTLQYDEEAKALAARRDQLKARYNELFKPPGKTSEEKIQAILKNLDKAIAMESQMLREGTLKRPPSAPQPSNQQIEDKRMELEAMRQLRRELYAETQPRKSAEDVALEQAIKAAKASIERMDQMMKTGNLTPAQRAARFNPTNELEALWSERDALRDAVAELRKAAKPRTDPEETRRKQAIKALEKSIRMLDERMLNNDFGPTPRKATRPEVQEVSELRDLRDAMRAAFNDLRKAQTPPKDPVAIRLARDKKVIQGRMKKLQEKINAGDYSTAVRPEPPTDAEKRQLQYDYAKLRETYLKGVFELQLRNRSLPRKIFSVIPETLNLSRAILTSADFSGVLRQGGFIAFGNPARAAKALPNMFKAFGSEQAQFAIEEDIKQRANYPIYQSSGLYLAENAPASLSQMEEAYMSRWVEKVPKILGGGLLRGSQRAYTTFLNQLRADSFDAMVATLTKTGAPTTAEAEAIANFVNVATGRGDLGKLAGAGVAMNTIFFAPRYVTSRFQLLALQPFYGGNARTRKLIAKEYGKYLTGIGAVVALLAMAGDDDDRGEILGFKVPLELDPRSSDFLKIRFGNTRLDPFSGLLQVTTLISRVGSGKIKNNKGELIPIRGEKVPYGSPDTTDIVMRFLRTKLSPAVGTGLDLASGKNVVGEPVGPKEAAIRGMIPISFGEILETMKEQGVPTGPALSLLSLFGVGLQTYAPRETKAKSKSKDPYKSKPLY